ncbi:hypothetical protein ACFLU1_00365 [Chloroflexota bacterium]
MAGVLDGVKVVAMELMEATPAASVWLADWGVDTFMCFHNIRGGLEKI